MARTGVGVSGSTCPGRAFKLCECHSREWLSNMVYTLGAVHLTKKIRAWGNIYALPISQKEARELGLRAGDEVDVELHRHGGGLDLSDIPTVSLGSHCYDLDEVAEAAALDNLAERDD